MTPWPSSSDEFTVEGVGACYMVACPKALSIFVPRIKRPLKVGEAILLASGRAMSSVVTS